VAIAMSDEYYTAMQHREPQWGILLRTIAI
jgi:hypothetical protein